MGTGDERRCRGREITVRQWRTGFGGHKRTRGIAKKKNNSLQNVEIVCDIITYCSCFLQANDDFANCEWTL